MYCAVLTLYSRISSRRTSSAELAISIRLARSNFRLKLATSSYHKNKRTFEHLKKLTSNILAAVLHLNTFVLERLALDRASFFGKRQLRFVHLRVIFVEVEFEIGCRLCALHRLALVHLKRLLSKAIS